MTSSSQSDGVARSVGGRHERSTDALIASYLRELLHGEQATAAEPQLEASATPPSAADPLADAELTA
jgi:hypothetical protein